MNADALSVEVGAFIRSSVGEVKQLVQLQLTYTHYSDNGVFQSISHHSSTAVGCRHLS